MYSHHQHVPTETSDTTHITAPTKMEDSASSSKTLDQAFQSTKFVWTRSAIPAGLLLIASALSTAHHLFYLYLNNQIAGSTDKQQWSIRIGTALATAIVILLKCAVGFAYVQLLWLMLRKRAFRISDIDALFALGFGDATALFSKGIWATAVTAISFAIFSILLPIATIFPPATLSVVLVEHSVINQLDVPQLDWNALNWQCGSGCISEPVLKIATQASQGGSILSLYEPAPNSSYRLLFEGPSISCKAPNATQQVVFDFYTHSSLLETDRRISSDLNSTFYSPGMLDEYLYWTAFVAPFNNETLEQPLVNVWTPELGPNYWTSTEYADNPYPGQTAPRPDIKSFYTAQLWIQTFDQNLVCTLMMAEFDVNVIFEQGSSTVTYNSVNFVETLDLANNFNNNGTGLSVAEAYENVFYAFTNALNGNISVAQDAQILDYSSNILSSSIAACPQLNFTSFLHQIPPSPVIPTELYTSNYQTLLGAFPSQPSDCRNQSVPRAIEDLMNNVTVSMLSSPYLTAYAPALVTIVTDQIVYAYQPLELIIAYAGSVAISILAVILGLFAARSNGIIHVSTFSALVRATRNPELDRLFADENMAGYPLSKYLDEQRLRFGQLAPQFVGPDSRQQDYVKTVFATEDRLMAR